MATDATDATVAATQAPPDGGLWIGISELARRKGVNKATISRRVAKLAGAGQLEVRPAKRGGKLVNIAAYDRVVGEVGDPAKEAGAETRAAAAVAPAPSGYRDAQTDKTRYEAELRRLDLAERRGQLVSVAGLRQALDKLGVEMRRIVDGLQMRADEGQAVAIKDGVTGTRRLYKQFSFDICAEIAAVLEQWKREGKERQDAGLVPEELPLGEE